MAGIFVELGAKSNTLAMAVIERKFEFARSVMKCAGRAKVETLFNPAMALE